jgi:hypothetical protein
VDGALAVADFFGSLNGREGFEGGFGGSVILGDPPLPFGFSFNGLACDAHLIFESYCSAGTFDFHLQGTVGDITFEDQVPSPKALAPRTDRARVKSRAQPGSTPLTRP